MNLYEGFKTVIQSTVCKLGLKLLKGDLIKIEWECLLLCAPARIVQGPSRVTTFSTSPSLQIRTGTLRTLKLMENMPRMMQEQSMCPWLPGGDTISVLNETGVSPEPPIDVIIF